jgi:hypothetical protein
VGTLNFGRCTTLLLFIGSAACELAIEWTREPEAAHTAISLRSEYSTALAIEKNVASAMMGVYRSIYHYGITISTSASKNLNGVRTGAK